MMTWDVAVIGGGPAGLSAAIAARRAGAENVVILERDSLLGGILNQCIHNGFGLHTFKEELSGPEYAARYVAMAEKENVAVRLNTTVISVGSDRQITCVSRERGLEKIRAKAVVLAMGCRERSRGALNIPGFRPAGVYSAGTAQRLMNIEGAKVKVVAEVMPYSGGLKRNIVQCLDDFGIPLKLGHTVVEIHGKNRLTGVTIAQVDERRRPIPGTEEYYSCDTLLLSVGLLPENELTRALDADMCAVTNGPAVNDRMETSVPGVFACGNVLHVHDLVDFVSEEAALAGQNAAAFADAAPAEGRTIALKAENGVRYTVPQHLDLDHMQDKITVRFRVADVYRGRSICVYCGEERISKKKRPIMAPGEMEQVVLEKSVLEKFDGLREIRICTEVDE